MSVMFFGVLYFSLNVITKPNLILAKKTSKTAYVFCRTEHWNWKTEEKMH